MPLCCPSFACGSDAPAASREWRLRSPWRVVRLALHSLSCPGLRAVVRRCSQGHTERQLLVTPVHPQPSLPSSLRSANGGLRAGVHHHKRSHSNGNADLRKDDLSQNGYGCWCVCGVCGARDFRERRVYPGAFLHASNLKATKTVARG